MEKYQNELVKSLKIKQLKIHYFCFRMVPTGYTGIYIVVFFVGLKGERPSFSSFYNLSYAANCSVGLKRGTKINKPQTTFSFDLYF